MRCKRATGGKGIDVVYDPIGGAQAKPALRRSDWGGRYLVVGFAAGDMPKLPLNLVLLQAAMTCSASIGAPGRSAIRRPPRQHDEDSRLVRPGQAQSSHVHAVYPLSEAAAALKAIAERKVMGKIVLRP